MGHSSVKLHHATWQDDSDMIYSVRKIVFVEEQGISEELDFDGLDPDCWHVLAYASQSEPIGTARMQKDGHIGRIAVLEDWRRKGVGTRLLQSLLKMASEKGILEVYLHAQIRAAPFYEKLGFKKEGDIFIEADIQHQKMMKIIA
jgi:predicted GNAT family N-acyltransferase